MPFCDIDKDVSLHYVTNTPRGDATDLDASKPTIILLPPMFCDAILGVREQVKDPRLSLHYNLIAFDQRNIGQTKAPVCKERDSWVDAADLAVAHERLGLQPCHIFAVGTNSGGAAQRFAILFPNKCLSLCLCSAPIPRGDEPKELDQGFLETVRAWGFPKDLEDIERVCMGFSWYGFAGQISPELEDEIVAWWQMNLPPTNRTRFLAQALNALNRSRFSDGEINAIVHPTIFLQGDKSSISPPTSTQDFCNKLPNARLCVVKGGPEHMNILPEYSSIINRLYNQFLAELSETTILPSSFTKQDPIGVCKAGLARLSAFAHDPSIADRDPSTPLSFSRLSTQEMETIAAQYAEFSKGEKEAFHALDGHGIPLRKFSERNVDEWKADAFQRQYLKSEIIVSRIISIT